MPVSRKLIGQRFIEEPKQSQVLSRDHIEAIWAHCPPDRLPFFWALLGTGARQGEILNLCQADIGLVPPTIVIRSRPGSKSRGKVRHVPISRELACCLEGLGNSDCEKLFPHSRHTVNRWWDQLAARLGIKGVTLHGFRATYITLALDAGVPPVDVQKIVGHSHLTVTMRYYRNPEESRRAAEAVGRALGLDRLFMGESQRLPHQPSQASSAGML